MHFGWLVFRCLQGHSPDELTIRVEQVYEMYLASSTLYWIPFDWVKSVINWYCQMGLFVWNSAGETRDVGKLWALGVWDSKKELHYTVLYSFLWHRNIFNISLFLYFLIYLHETCLHFWYLQNKTIIPKNRGWIESREQFTKA